MGRMPALFNIAYWLIKEKPKRNIEMRKQFTEAIHEIGAKL